jgi:hypothetical protein
MTELKINVPDELASRLDTFKDRLEEVIEIGLREFEPRQSLLYEDVVDFFANGPSIEEIVDLKPSQSANDRVADLLYKNSHGKLSNEESVELRLYTELNHILTLVKLRARRNLESK